MIVEIEEGGSRYLEGREESNSWESFLSKMI